MGNPKYSLIRNASSRAGIEIAALQVPTV